MRIWSLHPKYLDVKGLLALWRETLLAKKVLEDNTKGYKNHSQLVRFKQLENSLDAINFYLQAVWQEADNRGYKFDKSKFSAIEKIAKIPVTTGQIAFERTHLLKKLAVRDPQKMEILQQEKPCELHPLFTEIAGEIADWEKV